MSKVLIEESTLIAIGDSIRNKTGRLTRDKEAIVPVVKIISTPNATSFTEYKLGYYALNETVTIENAVSVKVKIAYQSNGGSYFYINNNQVYTAGGSGYVYHLEEYSFNTNKVNIVNTFSTYNNFIYAEITGYDAEGNIITGPGIIQVKNTLNPLDMPSEIDNIESLELPEEAYVLSGSCSWRWASPDGNWYFEVLGDKLTSKDITNLSYCFSGNSTLTKIPCTLNVKSCANFSSTFSSCHKLEECPKIRGSISWSISTSMSDLIKYCYGIVDFEDLFEPDMLDGFNTVKVTSAYSCAKPPTFYGARIMRAVPSWFYKFRLSEESTAYPSYSAGYNIYNSAFCECYVLDEVLNIPVWRCTAAQTTNMFQSTLAYCYRLKGFTFETQPDGTPYETKWKSQTIDFSTSTGYTTTVGNVVDSRAGITSDKEVRDDATYQALKDDPNWFTQKTEYSRYNHDSAVATINSLPDTSAYLASAGGTNTIKFKGTLGSKTDGGAINTLTAEEIAVATAKGWTVTLV